MTYRPDIDGLRAVAVLSVVLHHFGLGLPGGYVGVDVFFVLSGYLIASLMLADLAAGTFSLADFWERRIRRILPALFVVVAASFAMGWFTLVPRAYEMFGRSVQGLLAIKANHFFARHTDYFSGANDSKPLLHTWSLAVEEQFYLFVPLLFWAVARCGRRAWLGPICWAAAASSFACGWYGTTAWDGKAYFYLSARAWELLAGVLAAVYLPRIRHAPHALSEFLAGAGLVAVIVPCFVFDSATPFPGWAALVPVAGTVLIIAAGAISQRPTLVGRLLASRAAVGIGLISYSLYLWHWPLLVFARQQGWNIATAAGQALLLITTFASAYVTFRWVEQPFRRRRLAQTRPRLFALTAVGAVALFLAGHSLRSSHGLIERLPPETRQLAATSAPIENYFKLHDTSQVPEGLLRIGAAEVKPTVLVWGDSHAMMLLPALDEMFRSAGVAARCAVNPSRPPILHFEGLARADSVAESNAFGAAALRYACSPEIDVVVLAGIWSSYFNYPGFADNLRQTIDALHAAGRRVYFVRDVPKYDFDVAAVLIYKSWYRQNLQELVISQAEYDRQNRGVAALSPYLAEQGVEMLDPIPYLRGGRAADGIPPFDERGAFYSDNNHLSLHGSHTLQPMFVELTATAASLIAARKAKVAEVLQAERNTTTDERHR